MNKLKLLIAAVFALLIFAPAASSYAFDAVPSEICNTADKKNSVACTEKATGNPVAKTIGNVANIIMFVVGIAAVIIIIISGINYATSTGDSSKTSRAKDAIIYSAVGLIVTLFAWALTKAFVNRLL